MSADEEHRWARYVGAKNFSPYLTKGVIRARKKGSFTGSKARPNKV
jgi:hypothetical protein